MTDRRPRQSREQWKQIIDEYHSQQQDAHAFCHAHDLGYTTFCKWKRFFSHPLDTPPARTDFVALSPAVAATTENWDVELTLGQGIQLRLRTR